MTFSLSLAIFISFLKEGKSITLKETPESANHLAICSSNDFCVATLDLGRKLLRVGWFKFDLLWTFLAEDEAEDEEAVEEEVNSSYCLECCFKCPIIELVVPPLQEKTESHVLHFAFPGLSLRTSKYFQILDVLPIMLDEDQ